MLSIVRMRSTRRRHSGCRVSCGGPIDSEYDSVHLMDIGAAFEHPEDLVLPNQWIQESN